MYSKIRFVCVITCFMLTASAAHGLSFPPGTNHYEAQPGSVLHLNPGFVPFIPGPLTIDLVSNGDTIIERGGDSSPDNPATIDIEIVALSLVSTNPIQVQTTSGDSFFDIFVDVTTATPTVPVGVTRYPSTEYEADSLFDIFVQIRLEPIPGAPTLPPLPPIPPLDFVAQLAGRDFSVDSFFDIFVATSNDGILDVRLAPTAPPVPEPASMALLGLGVAALAVRRAKKS